MITNAINHALFAVHPKARYACGMDCKFAYRFALVLPDYIQDIAQYWIYSYYRIPNARQNSIKICDKRCK